MTPGSRHGVAVLMVGCLALAAYGSPIADRDRQQPAPVLTTTSAAASAPRPSSVDVAPPSAISIPSIGVDGPLVPLGIDMAGELEVPARPDDIGWFSGGGRPGGVGPTVIAGHVDSETGPAVFARLTELAAGDRVTVSSTDGTTSVYVVTAVKDVPQDDFPTQTVFGRIADDELRLITCTGDYDRDDGRYRENRVVLAVRA